MSTVISAENVSKSYRLGDIGGGTLRGDVARWWARFRGQPDPLAQIGSQPHARQIGDLFQALDNVSFEVQQGEVLGIIGRNGAGKSTLLKILSQVTSPTAGEIKIRGRIASLLEVGTGFHPELTGRENIFLNGAILGMTKAEIRRKFDAIVAFSEVEPFIDTPVKRYSSGMYVRLAFAVAAHLEPEILIVDEVLAVGDATFQKKCLGKMGEVSRDGRTILFVSHYMGAINALCSRVLMLKDGGIAFAGPTADATARYYAESLERIRSGASLAELAREGNGNAYFSSVSVLPLTPTGESVEDAYPGCNLRVEFEIECRSRIAPSNAGVIIYDQNGFRVIDANTAQKGHYVQMNAGEKAKVSFLLHDLLLKPGQYYVGLWLGRHAIETMDHLEHAAIVNVIEEENNSEHPITYPGVYQCRFEENVSILQPLLSDGAPR